MHALALKQYWKFQFLRNVTDLSNLLEHCMKTNFENIARTTENKRRTNTVNLPAKPSETEPESGPKPALGPGRRPDLSPGRLWTLQK